MPRLARAPMMVRAMATGADYGELVQVASGLTGEGAGLYDGQHVARPAAE